MFVMHRYSLGLHYIVRFALDLANGLLTQTKVDIVMKLHIRLSKTMRMVNG
nr:MAG TPA: hypothetical protein [Caudoviricetes sp.]